MKVLLDAMGGDHCPDEAIKGAVEALKKIDSDIILIGKKSLIEEKTIELFGKSINEISSRLSIINAEDVITNKDTPVEAIKTKKESSMIKGFELLKNGDVDVFVSAGNTGAFMAGGLLLLGRIKGIDRPALAAFIPTYTGMFMIADGGANTNCRAINLEQFAVMSSIYMNKVVKIDNPTVGLLNIGAEESKGNDLTKETYQLLKANKNINFVGNVEGRDLFDGGTDIVVCDGFTGNIAVKTAEGLGITITKMLKEELTSNIFNKILAGLLKPAFKKFKYRIDYTEHGGGILLGIKYPLVKCHGGAKAKSFTSTLVQAHNYAMSGAIEIIKASLESNESKIN